MINPHGINGVLGKGWCPKKEKRTRKAVVPSSEKEKRFSEKNENSCKFVCIYSSLLINNNYFRSFVSRTRGKAQDDKKPILHLPGKRQDRNDTTHLTRHIKKPPSRKGESGMLILLNKRHEAIYKPLSTHRPSSAESGDIKREEYRARHTSAGSSFWPPTNTYAIFLSW